MSNMLEYKGYHAKIEFDSEDLCIRGKIEGINDLITFESESTTEIEQEFHDAVDDYLIFCEEAGKEPDKEYKGSFNVRIKPELHKDLALYALRNNISLNAAVEKAVDTFLNKDHVGSTYIMKMSPSAFSSHEIKQAINKNNVVPFQPRISNTNYMEAQDD